MISVDGYKMFRGTMRIKYPKGDPIEARGDWLYKPEHGYWYSYCVTGFASSFSEESCEIVEDETGIMDKKENSLTNNEINICKLIGAKWVTRDRRKPDSVELWSGTKPPHNDYDGVYGCDAYVEDIAVIEGDLFPSVPIGECREVPV